MTQSGSTPLLVLFYSKNSARSLEDLNFVDSHPESFATVKRVCIDSADIRQRVSNPLNEHSIRIVPTLLIYNSTGTRDLQVLEGKTCSSWLEEMHRVMERSAREEKERFEKPSSSTPQVTPLSAVSPVTSTTQPVTPASLLTPVSTSAYAGMARSSLLPMQVAAVEQHTLANGGLTPKSLAEAGGAVQQVGTQPGLLGPAPTPINPASLMMTPTTTIPQGPTTITTLGTNFPVANPMTMPASGNGQTTPSLMSSGGALMSPEQQQQVLFQQFQQQQFQLFLASQMAKPPAGPLSGGGQPTQALALGQMVSAVQSQMGGSQMGGSPMAQMGGQPENPYASASSVLSGSPMTHQSGMGGVSGISSLGGQMVTQLSDPSGMSTSLSNQSGHPGPFGTSSIMGQPLVAPPRPANQPKENYDDYSGMSGQASAPIPNSRGNGTREKMLEMQREREAHDHLVSPRAHLLGGQVSGNPMSQPLGGMGGSGMLGQPMQNPMGNPVGSQG